MGRRVRVTFVVLSMVIAGILLPRLVSSREDVRDVRVVARNMTYYVDGIDGPNPTLRFLPGEQVRVSFRNEDRGMAHDLRIPAWSVGTRTVGHGDQDSITFRVPSTGSSADYACTPHSAMMGGKVVIQ
jgi:plastocyanin